MVDDIKLDKVSIPLTANTSKTKPDQQKSAMHIQQGDVTITNQLSKVVNSMLTDDRAAEDHARVIAMKHRIESGNYTTNIDTLAEKLWVNVFSSSIGG